VADVSSYLTFSLSPRGSLARNRGYLVFCGTFCHFAISDKVPAFSGGGLPCVARTFLPRRGGSGEKLATKYTKKIGKGREAKIKTGQKIEAQN
jgi:hypothetical protein